MTTEDMNKSLTNSDIQPIHGYGSPDSLLFRQTKEADLYFIDDSEVHLRNAAMSTDHVPTQSGQTTIKGMVFTSTT